VLLAASLVRSRPDSIKLKLEDFVDKRRLRALRAAHPIRPKKVGHGGLIASQGWAMLGNDHYGCCVWAGAAHETKLWTYEGSNKNTWFRDKDVLADYAQCTGFDPQWELASLFLNPPWIRMPEASPGR
jgi:hypothetical protein